MLASACSHPPRLCACPQITPLSRGLIYAVPPTLFVLNAFWFVKILKGALKLIFKAAPAHTAGSPAKKER